MRVFKAKSLEAAVEMAARFKRAGRYDWFRGQTHLWPPTPTIWRLGVRERKQAVQRLVRLHAWVDQTPGLEAVGQDLSALLAIAQHYGLPTHLLDFTSEPSVAGYFAATRDKRPRNPIACIFCLNRKDLFRFWRKIRKILPHYPELRFLKVPVPNLWRLEAQAGAFLECTKNWDRVYPMDRIEFPASAPPSFPTEDQVYPAKKSHLEMLLDQVIVSERYEGFQKVIRQAFPGIKIRRSREPKGKYHAQYFVRTGPPLRSDWQSGQLRGWLQVPREPFRSTVAGEICLRLDSRASAEELRTAVSYGVRRALEANPRLRRRAVRWTVLPQGRIRRDFSRSLDWLWNGLRCLPYRHNEIADAIGLCFCLHRLGLCPELDSDEQRRIVEECLGPSVRVEFSGIAGGAVRGFAADAHLRTAVSDEFVRSLAPPHRTEIKHVGAWLQLCWDPRRMFRYREFAAIFATQIAPIQVLTAGAGLCHFSPARLTAFGLP